MSNRPPTSPAKSGAADRDLQSFLIHSGLSKPDSKIVITPMSGGVSCDVWRVDVDAEALCVKRALPKLRVAKLWEASVSRSESEWNWLTFAKTVVPHAVPRALAHDPVAAMIAIEFLDPSRFPVWKQLLLQGVAPAKTAVSVAGILARIHAASAGDPEIASRFRARDAFYALRIEPYLIEAARQNPTASDALRHLAEQTLETEIALVHGDVSPKNILVGPDGPVFLDAETAWFGDPAFDVAFCLNHLLLKCLARPDFAEEYLFCFRSFRFAYLQSVQWEDAAAIEARAARLLPGLLLARVDGKSPVEYLTETHQSFVRNSAIALIGNRLSRLDEIAEIWRAKVTVFNSQSEHPRAG